MAGKDVIYMSLREVKRLKAVHEAIGGRITRKAAAAMMGVCERQARRLVMAVRAEGGVGIVHKGRGRASNRKTPDKVKDKVIFLCKGRYGGFGPLLATEKLLEMEGVRISDETLRGWLMEAGLWEKRHKRAKHRRWRQRKECFGEMARMDGSHHDWLEGRGPELIFMGYIDAAANNVYGRFYDYEGTLSAMDGFKTIAHDGRLYRIESAVRTKKVMVEERTDGSMRITGDGVCLNYREITERPAKEPMAKTLRPRRPYIPPKDHPWRKRKTGPSRPVRDGSSPLTE
ncbi:MAG: hypothetical protein HZB84_06215 [Deltaproteobacteria bacterium]|nr:hypothetical protein [Deltaproteobacteria bacterium]